MPEPFRRSGGSSNSATATGSGPRYSVDSGGPLFAAASSGTDKMAGWLASHIRTYIYIYVCIHIP